MQSEILRLEFERKGADEQGRISEVDLADLILAYANYNPRKRAVVLKRIKKQFKVTMDDNETFLRKQIKYVFFVAKATNPLPPLVPYTVLE